MKRTLVAAALVAAASFAVIGAHGSPAANATCGLNGKVKHVIYLQFDNTHYRRDRSNVPSDLEQMPHLLDFMKSNGTLFTNDHTVLITRTGCDVGGVGTANIELENTATNASGDMTKVFGANSPEWNEAVSNPQLAQTDFVGIAIHCGNAANSKCANNANAKDDLLPDEPGSHSR